MLRGLIRLLDPGSWLLAPVRAWVEAGPASVWVGPLSSGPADPLRSAPADSIEANVEHAEVHVERGTEQLHRAAYYQVGAAPSVGSSLSLIISSFLLVQQKSRRRMCVLAVGCSVALLILAIIIWRLSQ